MKRRWPVFVSSSNSRVTQRLAHPVFIYDITHTIFISSSSKGLGYSQMYIRQDIRNALPAFLSPEKLGGRAGLREMFLQPVEEVVMEGGLCMGLCTFRACMGPSLSGGFEVT